MGGFPLIENIIRRVPSYKEQVHHDQQDCGPDPFSNGDNVKFLIIGDDHIGTLRQIAEHICGFVAALPCLRA